MLRLDGSHQPKKDFVLPPDIEAEVSRQVTDVDVDRLPDQPQVRYVVVQQQPPQTPQTKGSWFGRIGKKIAVLAAAAAIAATAWFGMGALQNGAPIQDVPTQPAIEQVDPGRLEPNAPMLPGQGQLPGSGNESEVAPATPQLPSVDNSVEGPTSISPRDFVPADGQIPDIVRP